MRHVDDAHHPESDGEANAASSRTAEAEMPYQMFCADVPEQQRAS